jgi:hypothetical protein
MLGNPPKSPKMPRNRGLDKGSPGIDGRHLNDTNNFIRGLHGEYLVSWGQKTSIPVAGVDQRDPWGVDQRDPWGVDQRDPGDIYQSAVVETSTTVHLPE